MRAMVMAAGVGNRLMPLTENIPKPMVPICNIPVMEYGIELLKTHGIKEIIANLHYLPNNIADYFKEGKEFNVSLAYSSENTLMGTAGGVKNNEWFLKNDTFIILSGDSLTDIDLSKLVAFHKSKGALATIALKNVKEVSQYGVVIRDNDEKIIAFQEKPKPEEALSNMVNTGIYVFEPEIFNLIPAKKIYDFGKQLFPSLVKLGLPFYGFECEDAYWCDVGSLKAYHQANIDVIKEKVITNLTPFAFGNNVRVGKNTEFKDTVIVGDNCIVEDDVVIKNTIILPGTTVKKSSIILNSIVGSNCIIEQGCAVKDTVLADKTVYTEKVLKELAFTK